MALVCPVDYCGRQMPGSRRICQACTAELGRALHAAPALLQDLDDAITRQTRFARPGESGGHRTAYKPPLPWDELASQAAATLTAALLGWARQIAAGRRALAGPTCERCSHPSCRYADLSRGAPTQPTRAAAWLNRHTDALIRHPHGPQAVTDIVAATQHAHHTIDAPERDLLFVGPCDNCAGDLYARPGATLATCTRCRDAAGRRLSYGIEARRSRMLRTLAERTLVASDIARALSSWIRPITPALIHTWVARGKLHSTGLDARGRKLFRVRDVMDLMDAPHHGESLHPQQSSDMITVYSVATPSESPHTPT